MMPRLIAGAVTRQSGMWRLVVVCALVLATLLPSLAFAAKPAPLSAGGKIKAITPGTVKPAGDSGRFVVVERELGGTLAGPDLAGDFTLTYKANVELLTQAGDLHGTMKVGDKVLNVSGRLQPLQVVGVIEIAPGVVAPKLRLNMTGHWNFSGGAQGQGTVAAWAVFIPTPDGHVGQILASAFSLNGQ